MTEPDLPGARALEDEWLVVRCQLGERPAFDELIRRWHEPLLKYLRRMAGDDDAAGDLVQDLWLRVIRGIGRLRDGRRFRPWLFGIARRVAMDRLRQQYAAPPIADVELTDLPQPEPSTVREDELALMQQELSRLPATEREVLTLFYLQELSLEEVAEVLGVPLGTVKSRLFRARQMLRREMKTREG